jgi:hypothetical protein
VKKSNDLFVNRLLDGTWSRDMVNKCEELFPSQLRSHHLRRRPLDIQISETFYGYEDARPRQFSAWHSETLPKDIRKLKNSRTLENLKKSHSESKRFTFHILNLDGNRRCQTF